MTLPYVVILYPWVVLVLPVHPGVGQRPCFSSFFELFSLVLGHEHSRLEIRTGIFLFLCYVFCLGALPNVIPSCARLFSVSVGLRPDRRIEAG